jgi:hypothetical protein
MNGIYLIGAGRSGTTLLASILGNNKEVICLGELHQFWDYLLADSDCSCGQPLSKCPTWSVMYSYYHKNYSLEQLKEIQSTHSKWEGHSQFFSALLRQNNSYTNQWNEFYSLVRKYHPEKTLLDSSKYVSRGLRLQRSKEMDMKYIYMVRDVRGVIYSFGKNVQTPKKPLPTIVYYVLINLITSFAVWKIGAKNTFRLRYEDLIANPSKELERLASFLELDLSEQINKLEQEKTFQIPHIVGGNRLKKESKIKLKPDIAWQNNLSFILKQMAYLLSFPFMLINRYRR